MNAARLLAHYEQIADAPDAIARLRRFILDLAARGKLVPQDPNDEPAAELLKRIAKEKARSPGRNKTLPPIEGAEKPFDAPPNWHWARMGDVFSIRTGFAFKSSTYADKGTLVFRVTNFDRDGAFDLSDAVYFPTEKIDTKMSGFLMEPGEIIMVMVGGTIGKTTIVDASILPALLNQNMWRMRSFGGLMANKFEYLLIKNINQSIQGVTQSTHGHFAMSDYEKRIIAFPPLAEQHRIVAKVEALMALCDRLEAAQASREGMRDRLAVASLTRLNAPDPETFEDDARFALDALPALTTRPDQIRQCRQTVLNLAVRGKLVPQDPTDELAINFDQAIPDDLERPFEIPRTWNWARLHTLGKLKGGGTPSKANDDFWNGNIPWVSPKDMKIDYIAEAQMSISEAAIAGSAANLINTGSILFVVRGMILAHSFPVAISRAPLAINQDMKALILKKSEMAEYILRALKGVKPEMLKRVQRSSHGTCRLEGSDYSDFLIPIPPVAEQHRIVAKVDALTALCDRLEASLTATAAIRRRLLDALLAEALAPADDRELEAAE